LLRVEARHAHGGENSVRDILWCVVRVERQRQVWLSVMVNPHGRG